MVDAIKEYAPNFEKNPETNVTSPWPTPFMDTPKPAHIISTNFLNIT